MTKDRNSSIELLRILCALGVVCLHYNNPIGFNYVAHESVNQLFLCVLEVLSCSAVNVYIIITGYFLATTNNRIAIKPVNLLAQVVFYHIIFYFVYLSLGEAQFSLVKFVTVFLPNNWFVTLYVTLYIISPYLNVIADKLDQRQFKKMLILCILLFCGWNFVGDFIGKYAKNDIVGLSTIGMFGSQGGCTIVNFSLLYLIGAYIRKTNLSVKYLSVIKILGGALLLHLIMLWVEYNYWGGWESAISLTYLNPFVIIESICLFLLSKSISFKNIIINKLAKCSFTCFLIQNIFLKHANIDYFVSQSLFLLILHILVTIAIIYLFSYLFYLLWNFVIWKYINLIILRIKD